MTLLLVDHPVRPAYIRRKIWIRYREQKQLTFVNNSRTYLDITSILLIDFESRNEHKLFTILVSDSDFTSYMRDRDDLENRLWFQNGYSGAIRSYCVPIQLTRVVCYFFGLPTLVELKTLEFTQFRSSVVVKVIQISILITFKR